MNIPRIFLFIKVLHLWAYRHWKSLTPEFWISKILQWQRAGYVSKDVWNEMDKIVDPELLPSQEDINEASETALAFEEEAAEYHVTDETEKLTGIEIVGISDILFYCIFKSVYPSKRKHFTLHALGLEESEYDKIITEMKGAWKRNSKVVFENGI